MTSAHEGWIGVDLDGTLAKYDNVWRGPEFIGEPIAPMVARVKSWLAEGLHVKIFTARVSGVPEAAEACRLHIEAWALKHIGQVLEVTNLKDYGMVELWDDRCVRVVPNTGERCCG